jgi:hypothetical protein
MVVHLWLIYDHIPSCIRPSFKDITLYQLCYWKVTHIYGLTQEEIKDLLTNPDPHIPSHHQVDPRIIKAYLTGESIREGKTPDDKKNCAFCTKFFANFHYFCVLFPSSRQNSTKPDHGSLN